MVRNPRPRSALVGSSKVTLPFTPTFWVVGSMLTAPSRAFILGMELRR